MQAPLTRAELRDIQSAFLKAPKVMRLLREIKRARLTALELSDLAADADTKTPEQARAALQQIHNILSYEACVAEHEFDVWYANADPITLRRNTSPRAPKYKTRIFRER